MNFWQVHPKFGIKEHDVCATQINSRILRDKESSQGYHLTIIHHLPRYSENNRPVFR